MQWNVLAATGVNAPQAWANLIADYRPSGRGVTVAILDAGKPDAVVARRAPSLTLAAVEPRVGQCSWATNV